MTLHESCTTNNDIAVNNPIKGTPTIRKVLAGVWTRTIICADCGTGGGGGSSGACYGSGGSGKGYLIKSGTIKEGGTTHRPNQTLMVWEGGA